MRARIPFRERMWCSVEEACDVSGLRRTKLFEMIATGELVSRKGGGEYLSMLYRY